MPLRLVVLAMALLLSGCGMFSSRADRALRASPDFKAGYSDGCASAGNRGANPREDSLIRDDSAFQTNKAYHSGWGTGFGACRSFSMPNGPIGPNGGPLASPRPM
jgi:hypothetical protein